ncbi:MAG: hypothetical protein P4L69_12160 [Desulfosporosinus sp.]|nr:hypothetical protein [Desulfosporosinus sp.]
MTLYGFDIQKLSPSLKKNNGACIFLGLALIAFCISILHSGYFRSYCLGDSNIPREDQLVRSGPYTVRTITIRGGTKIGFTSIATGAQYALLDNDFYAPNFRKLVHYIYYHPNQLEAYLWLSEGNPFRKIWEVDISNQIVLSYDRALWDYQLDSDPTFWFECTVLFFVMFLISMFTITRTPNGDHLSYQYCIVKPQKSQFPRLLVTLSLGVCSLILIMLGCMQLGAQYTQHYKDIPYTAPSSSKYELVFGVFLFLLLYIYNRKK